MFLLPILVAAIVGVVFYTVLHRRAQPVTLSAPATVPVRRASIWPTTVEGRGGIGAFALSVLTIVLVNVIQVPYLSAVTLLAAVVLTGLARFAKHDNATSVVIVLGVTALAALAGLLFLAGEVFIGHE